VCIYGVIWWCGMSESGIGYAWEFRGLDESKSCATGEEF
jgi:hypothetical protein